MSGTAVPAPSLPRGLAAAVAHTSLRSILLFDADMDQFEYAAGCVRELLDAFTQVEVEQVSLGAYHHDEQLWDGDSPLREGGRGLLVQMDHVPGDRLVLIRDLSSLSAEAVRACVQLMDAPVAHLERHGRKHTWTPRLFWLAACRRDAVGQVSGHLLDRFALRFDPRGWAEGRRERLRAGLTGSRERASIEPALRAQVVGLRRRLKQGSTLPPPPIAQDLLDPLLERIRDAQGIRRQLGVARLAAGLARLDHARLSSRHVEEAALLCGVPRAPQKSQSVKNALESALGSSPSAASAVAQTPGGRVDAEELRDRLARPSKAVSGVVGDLRSTDAVEQLAPALLAASVVLEAPLPREQHGFPEDETRIGREYAMLKGFRRTKGSAFGAIIGVQRTTRAEEIAMLPTILAAAPYQTLRRARTANTAPDRALISEADWRSYRRAPDVERMLVLLLDLTSVSDCLFELVPYLHEAYVERAAVRVVVVGAANARNELCAELICARNLLAPELRKAFDSGPGRATPLAHGLSLVTRITREHCFRGRGSVHGADVVIATDGLGNIPLSASQGGKLLGRVTREGIDDALRTAEDLRNLKGAHVVAVPPKRLRAKAVFASLVEALGAELHPLAKSAEQP